MKRKNKIIFGVITILFALISAGIGLWLLSAAEYAFTVRFVMGFFLMFTPVITALAIINLLKKDR
ncbi:hypothetical protein [Clostridium sp. D33t1_170424_F3]|uniref:hypothetical protein n=1 Tax=Clostridium sp. D33t1_170424_F3 TaxID=2787099 RepID=UPI0018AC24A5|nr:hypothetical protein [Clostridium sp. D33t1_170424_F3]